jgi:hypothetical protein
LPVIKHRRAIMLEGRFVINKKPENPFYEYIFYVVASPKKRTGLFSDIFL